MQNMPVHTDKQYEEELRQLKESILKMGGIVEEMIARAMKALVERDSQLATEVIHRDPEANQMELKIDEQCVQLLALRQPAGSDLRFITIGLRISKDLERMGDLAVNIAEQSLELNKEPQLKPYVDLPQMAAKAQQMVKNSLDAFVNWDAALAERVCEVDDDVDDLNRRIFLDLLKVMQKDPMAIPRGAYLMSVTKHLERIADHATNIAEEVIFMAQGRDIRHGGKR